jgi:hypothetical protein
VFRPTRRLSPQNRCPSALAGICGKLFLITAVRRVVCQSLISTHLILAHLLLLFNHLLLRHLILNRLLLSQLLLNHLLLVRLLLTHLLLNHLLCTQGRDLGGEKFIATCNFREHKAMTKKKSDEFEDGPILPIEMERYKTRIDLEIPIKGDPYEIVNAF